MEGIEKGESTQQIGKRIETVTEGEISRGRAVRIARTETAFAHIKGTEEGWRQSGVVRGSRFVLAPDACPVCVRVDKELKGKVFKLGQPYFETGTVLDDIEFPDGTKRPFVLDYEPEPGQGLIVPPVHPHCRCTREPILMDEV